MQSIPYVKSSGRDASLEDLTFTLTRVLAFDTANKALSLVKTDAPVYKGASMYIAALNGLLSKHATSNRSSVISVGPNKFFLQDGFRKLPMDFLNVNRGYFSSVRPGSERVLLNVGTKAGAFYQVQRVSDCVDAMSDRKHVSEYDYSKRCSLVAQSEFAMNARNMRSMIPISIGTDTKSSQVSARFRPNRPSSSAARQSRSGTTSSTDSGLKSQAIAIAV